MTENTGSSTWLRRTLLAFLAGFGATLLAHQPVLALLHGAGVVPRPAYNFSPVPPFGVPSVISLSFWGGVWGVIMIWALSRVRPGAAWWIASAVFGAVLPTLVAATVVMPLKGVHVAPEQRMSMLAIGLLVNAAWGLGTALLYRLFVRT
jgi:hypothetical protein